ncbi:MAG: tRNA 4-thiouridine(8) synthase ThiI [Candidatus Goldbacteria bacterium]|nr:tRNA 4-thiouridine(8) synthase ThiI [Candidatus Goldiibacteriota bacterium]
MNLIRCLALFSGGLDSLLAVKLIKQQNIDVIILNFDHGFFFDAYETINNEKKYKGKLPPDFDVKVIDISNDFYKMIKNPEFGFGSNMNPCIDCKIMMLKKAKDLMKEFNANFVITGEVLGQRPMTQNLRAMNLIEEKSGLTGYLLRPLSARKLKPTEPEKLGWVDRSKLMDIEGRSRKIQLEFARKLGLEEYIKTPGGGCILTDENYSKRLRDLLDNNNKLTRDSVELLTIGRQFRKDGIKFIIGRKEAENKKLLKYKDSAIIFDCVDVPGPVGITFDRIDENMENFIASAVAGYSDGKKLNEVKVEISNKYKKKIVSVKPIDIIELRNIRIDRKD